MKRTLRERMEAMLIRLKDRKEQLRKNIEGHVGMENYTDAAKCQIKAETLQMVIDALTNELKEK